jgi:hypothetical protein
MKKLVIAPLFALALAFAVNIPVSIAQDNTNEDKFSFGKVVSVNAQEVMVKEYDFAKDADVEVAYTITGETEFGNVNAVTDLAANDDIVIDYVEKDGKRVVTTLVKEDKGAEAPMVSADAEVAAPVAEVPAAAVAAPAATTDVPAVEAAVPAATEAPAAAVEAPAQK